MSPSRPAASRVPDKGAITTERRACDACFKLKEKCVFAEDDDNCERCRRLSKRCTSERPIRPSGRPRKERNLRVRMDASTLQSISQGTPLELMPFGVLTKDLKPVEEFMFRMFLDSSNFNELMVAPRVGQAMHREAMFSLLYNYDDMHDGYFSMFGSFAIAMGLEIPGLEPDTNTRRGSMALKKFSEMKCPTNRTDFFPWLWLGTALTIHTHCVLGTNGGPIRRYMLSHLLKMAQHGVELRSHPVVLITISLDAVDSLLKREMPVFKYPHFGNDEHEDETLGLCAQLMGFVYEICEVSYAMAKEGESEEQFTQLCEIESRLELFTARISPKMAKQMSAMEMAHLYSQVRVHKDSYLLITHRLKYPFGREDGTATMMAQNIMTDLAMSTSISGSPPSWVTLPFMTASIEMQGNTKRQRALDNINMYVDGINPVARSSAREWLQAIWRMRDDGPGFKWLDVMDKLPTICINHVGSVREIPGIGQHASIHNVSTVKVRSVPIIGPVEEPEHITEVPAGCQTQ